MYVILANLPTLLQAATPHPAHDDGFLPHGFCYLWNRPLLWTHLTSDVLIGVSYVVISFALAALVHRARRDIPFSVVFVAFGLFIITCGLTHFMEVWTLWRPVYWLSAYVKVLTAAASVSTAIAMPFMVPRVHATIRDARLSRERELAAARVEALEESNELLQQQAVELEQQREEAETLAEELEQTNRELRIAVREAEEARMAAEAASRAKTEFLTMMSHELRTPLNAIGGYAELLEMELRGPITPAMRDDLQRLRRSQRHLLSIVNDVLNFARVDSRALLYDIADVPVAAVLADVEPLVRPQLGSRRITFVPGECVAGVVARADADKVRQVLLNLLSNAVKFTEPGGTVTLSCGVDGADVLVTVRDSGRGIPADKLDSIFQPFVQVERGLTRAHDGIGLGLSISRELARAMGGDLTVQSAPGCGSTFVLRLPRA